MRLHALYHVPFEGVGSIGAWVADRGHELVETRCYAGDALPQPADYDLLVVMGGPMGVADEAEHPWLTAGKKALEAVLASDRPVLGICLGAQLLASVLGAAVTRNPVPEIGWFPVAMTQAGQTEPALAGLPDIFPAFHWHGDTFAIPAGAVHAATSTACPNQAFVFQGRVVGLQFHLETTPAAMQNLITHCPDDLATPAPTVQTAKQMHAGRAALKAIKPLMYSVLDALAAGRSA